MGRRPRRNRHARCQPPNPQRSGKALAWVVICLVTAWETASPTLCRPAPPDMRVASDGGTPLPPVPVETWADSGVGGGMVAASGGPEPSPGQKPAPCEPGMTEMRGFCWYELKDRAPRCPSGSVAWDGRCWVPVNGGLKRPPVAAGEP